MTRFQPQGTRIGYTLPDMTDAKRETPGKQLIGLYGMWNSLGPETKLRIKKALGIELNPEDELALNRLDEQRAAIKDYLDSKSHGGRLNRLADLSAAYADEQDTIRSGVKEQLAAAQRTALDTPSRWDNTDTTFDETSYDTSWQNIIPTGRTPRRDPDLSRSARYVEGIHRPSISWLDDFSDTWEY